MRQKHAIAIITESGIEILLHIGIDTVKMNGEGFKSFVNCGDKVKAGDKLLEVDLDLIEERATSKITAMVITNTDNFKSIKQLKFGSVNLNEKVVEVNFN